MSNQKGQRENKANMYD